MNVDPLLAEIAELIRRVDLDEDVIAEVGDLSSRAALVGRSIDADQRDRLLEGIHALERSVEAAMERIAEQLRETGARRTAISAYGAVRSHKRGQTLRTRV